MNNYPKGLALSDLRNIDQKAQALGMEEVVLIENASSNLFDVIAGLDLGKKALIIAGRGNNGADVLSCARKMLSRGYTVKVVVLAEKALGRQAKLQKDILENIKVSVQTVLPGDFDLLKPFFEWCDFILEGILGIGVKGEISPFLKEAVNLINQSKKKVIACDIPSGLSPDEGLVLGAAVKAAYTVSFIAPKKGFFLNQGPEFCGKIFVVDIGVSKEIIQDS